MQTIPEKDRLYAAIDLMMVTEKKGRLLVLLSQRTAEPHLGRWAFPGCFLGLSESAEEAADRLLAEMLPIGPVHREQLYTFTDAGRDHRGRVISIAYLVIIPWQRLESMPGSSSLQAFTVQHEGGSMKLLAGDGEQLQPGELAFDHGRMLEMGIARLKGKIEYTNTAFYFLSRPEGFALGQVQRIFEAVLGRKLDSSNFRRYMNSRYEETGIIQQTEQAERGRRGRPAVLYRFNHEGGKEA